LTVADGWIPILCSRSDALLVSIDEAAIERHGIPMHLRPRVWRSGTVGHLAESCPLLAAMLLHCGDGVRFGCAA
jgi:hypothetical protein